MKNTTPNYTPRPWKGYTMEQIRWQQALTSANIMMEKTRIQRDTAYFKNFFSFKRSTESSSSLMGRVFGSISLGDWISLGMTAGRHIIPFFRHKK